jgi:hypothetical protein
LRRNDLRTGLISKRSSAIKGAKDYAKKIREARAKMNESGSSRRSSSKKKTSVERKSPAKDSEETKPSGRNEDDEDFLAIVNDINFDEDENESTAGEKKKDTSMKDDESNAKETKVEKDVAQDEDNDEKAGESSKDKKSRNKSKTRSRTPSNERARKFEKVEYFCIHCGLRSTSAQVRILLINGD